MSSTTLGSIPSHASTRFIGEGGPKPKDMFSNSVTLLEQRRVRLVQKGTSPRADDVEAVGWFDDDFAYLLPEAARRRVATFLRESGEPWAHSAHARSEERRVGKECRSRWSP